MLLGKALLVIVMIMVAAWIVGGFIMDRTKR